MKVYDYSKVRQNYAVIFNTALKENVIITRKDGNKFKLVIIHEQKKGRSPLEAIKGIKAKVSMGDILDAIREGRERK